MLDETGMVVVGSSPDNSPTLMADGIARYGAIIRAGTLLDALRLDAQRSLSALGSAPVGLPARHRVSRDTSPKPFSSAGLRDGKAAGYSQSPAPRRVGENSGERARGGRRLSALNAPWAAAR